MSDSTPWIAAEAGDAAKKHAPAAARNVGPLVAALGGLLPRSGIVLEVASGSGEHALAFARAFPALEWQPSDADPACRASMDAWRSEAGTANLRPALALDAAAGDWPVDRADALLCINMVHIAPWAAAEGLFAGAGRLLARDAPLILYGPFVEPDVPTAPSNLAFDADLRARDPAWGLRDTADLDRLAAAAGLARSRRIAMPANNLLLVWRKS